MSGKGMNWRRVGWEKRMRERGTVDGRENSDRDAAARRLNRPRRAKPKKSKPSKWEKKRTVVPGAGDPCPRCGVPMEIREHNGIGEKQLRQPFFYTRWFCCRNPRCKTTLVMPERYKVLQPVVLGDIWDDFPDASDHQY
jgi:hypothetical protein